MFKFTITRNGYPVQSTVFASDLAWLLADWRACYPGDRFDVSISDQPPNDI